MNNYIGISDNRLHHMIGVARKAYALALDRGHSEEFAKKMFVLGWNHDIGYEFSKFQSEHSSISTEMISSAFDIPPCNNGVQAISKHGAYVKNETEEWRILNMADMLIDSKGNEVTVSERLSDIRERYGDYSNQYLTA